MFHIVESLVLCIRLLPMSFKARVDATLPVLCWCLHVMDPERQLQPGQAQTMNLLHVH